MSRTVPAQDTAPFADWMGISLVATEPGRVTLALAPRPEMTNRRGDVHGGALATLLDSAMARAARSLESVDELAGTVDLHVQYMRPASGPLEVIGQVEHHSRTLAFCRGEVRNARGELVATGICTLRLRRAGGSDSYNPPTSNNAPA